MAATGGPNGPYTCSEMALRVRAMTIEMSTQKQNPIETVVRSLAGRSSENYAAPSFQSHLQTALGFMAAKTLLSAVEIRLFTELAQGPIDAEAVRRQFNLHPRGVRDFLDTLVALRLLERHGNLYANTPDTDHFLDRNKPTYAGG